MLEKAIAHVECKVVSRMETPDHWITYCEATEGNVANADKKTAVHRRKVRVETLSAALLQLCAVMLFTQVARNVRCDPHALSKNTCVAEEACRVIQAQLHAPCLCGAC